MFKVNDNSTRSTSYMTYLKIFYTFPSFSIVDFKQVNVNWGMAIPH